VSATWVWQVDLGSKSSDYLIQARSHLRDEATTKPNTPTQKMSTKRAQASVFNSLFFTFQLEKWRANMMGQNKLFLPITNVLGRALLTPIHHIQLFISS